ncbi:MAG: LysE family translocator [Hyphomicrobiales bacterium]|nr:LysE family translocator [Hyphomicrobiales bacterium]
MDSLFVYFLIAVFVINVTPGPAMMFVLQQSQRNGVRMGLLAALGIEVGVFIYVILTVFGISAIFELYPGIYNGIQICGAIYLLYLAYQSWPRKGANLSIPQISGYGVFVRGLFINLTNPKIVLFFLSLLPQFVPAGSPTETFILYGIIFNIGGVLVNGAVAILSGFVARLLEESKWYNYVPPILFIVISIYSITNRLTRTPA